jgi:ribosomal protein L11 methylase PrmA
MQNDGMFDTGSFRDPGGHIYHLDGRVFRLVADRATPDYEYVRGLGLLRTWAERGWVIGAQEVDPQTVGSVASTAPYVLEHPRLSFISYPYEWPFPALQSAAILHLDLQLAALEHDVQLADASAYNIQFRGTHPIFIDVLSFRRYRDGDFWTGHRQFCAQFLNPLLLRALLGVPYHAWYRGSLEGIGPAELDRLLPLRRKLSLNVLSHVTLPARWEMTAMRRGGNQVSRRSGARLPRASYRGLLVQLRDWIARLSPRETGPTAWSEYDRTHTYDPAERARKQEVVAEFVRRVRPHLLWDWGCNTGEYAELSLEAGAQEVIGFDTDHAALETAFARARQRNLHLLPLYLDAANPSPDQGWAGGERKSLQARGGADALLALAFAHHVAIARNVPLDQVLAWLTSLAPCGVVEFVRKDDPTVQQMLGHREDVFDTYDEATFVSELRRHARIERAETVSASGRRLFVYDRT